MHNETEIGFVESHAERAGCDKRLQIVGLEPLLELFALGGIGAPGVGVDLVSGISQQSRRVLRRGDREGVDDSASRQVGEMAEQPAEPGLGVGEPEHTQAKRRPRQRTADGHDLALPGVVGVTELLRDIRHHPAVGRCRGRENGNARGQLRDEVAEATIVRPKIVAPIGDAVGLVDDEQAGSRDQRRQLLISEARVVEPLR